MPHYISLLEARAALSHANKILVIGCSGGGKSTLSENIAIRHQLNLISIDRDVRWLPGWKEREKIQQRSIIANLVRQDRWVMDGSGASTFDLRLPHADLVLWVKVPRYIALLGVFKRAARYFGSVRPMMAKNCPEKFPDRTFLSYIWNFEKRDTPVFIRQIDLHGPEVPVCILDSHQSMNRLCQ